MKNQKELEKTAQETKVIFYLGAILIVLLSGLLIFSSLNVFADNNDNDNLIELSIKKAQTEYNNSQFLIEIAMDGKSQQVKEYLFIIDHSIYEISVSTWNLFCKNYNSCVYAIRAYKQGWNVQFDDLLY